MRQSLIEGHRGIRVAPDATFIPEGLAQRLTEHDRGVLDDMVPIDVHVSAGLDVKVNQGMPGQRGEHVIVETDPGRDPAQAGSVKVEGDGDL